MDITNFNDDVYPLENDENISTFIPPLSIIQKETRGFQEHLVISLEEAVRLAIEYFRYQELKIDIYLLNDLIRYHTKRFMKEKANLELFEEYEIDDKLANNGLAGNYAGYHIRVWKGRDDGLLIPNSDVKASFFCQQLEFNLGAKLPVSLVNKRPNIIFLWGLDNNLSLTPLRFVCPKYGVKHHRVTEVFYDSVLPTVLDYKDDTKVDSDMVSEADIDELDITKKDGKEEITDDNKGNNEEEEE